MTTRTTAWSKGGAPSALVLALALLLTACQGGEDVGTGGDTAPREERFASFESFLANQSPNPNAANQVVFIGIDGASWHYIDALIAEGSLPNLARIKREGTYGDLESVPCYVSPPAWVSMHSGYSPSKTGIYTFGKWDWELELFKGVNAADVEVPAVWDIASAAGRKVAVANVPVTYPVHSVSGIMVSGLLTPIIVHDPVVLNRRDDITVTVVPPSLPDAARAIVLTDSLNTIVVWSNPKQGQSGGQIDVTAGIYSGVKTPAGPPPGGFVSFATGDYSGWLPIRSVLDSTAADAWCKLLVTIGPDGGLNVRTSQVVFDIRSRGVQYTHPESLADRLSADFGLYLPSKFLNRDVIPSVARESAGQAMYLYDYDDWDLFYYVFTQTDNIHHLEGFSARTKSVYEAIDGFLGRLMESLPEQSTLIVASDHGFDAFQYGVDLNKYFELVGLLVRGPDGYEIDHDKTMVFHNMWYLYFNHDLVTSDNLRRLGVQVRPGEDLVDAFARWLQDFGRRLGSSDGTLQFPLEFTRCNDDYVGDDPDMLVRGTYTGYLVEFWNIRRPRDGVVWHLLPSEKHNHLRAGIFAMWGNHIKQGYDAGTRSIEDIAPTTYYLMGLPLAGDLDGSAIYDAIDRGFLSATDRIHVADYEGISREFKEIPDDRQSLEKKLKSLGYVQ